MPFVEFQPNLPAHEASARRPGWERLLTPFVVPVWLVFNLCPPLARLFGERTTHVESDGWLAEWGTARGLCTYCGARVRRIEFEGQPLPLLPEWDNPSSREPIQAIATPVGVFMPWKGRWGRGHWEPPRYIVEGTFDVEDQRRGWYATEYRDHDGRPLPAEEAERAVGHPERPICRKAGTPPDWYLLENTHPRWADPRRLTELACHPAGA